MPGKTNIGHGGPGLRQRWLNAWVLWRRVCIGSLLMCGLVGYGYAAAAQGAAGADVKRIQQARDLAEQPAMSGRATAEVARQQAAEANVEAPSEQPIVLSANESLPLGVGGGIFAPGHESNAAPETGGDDWLLSTLAALGVVIGLVFVIRWALRRGGVVTTAAPKGSVVEVLSRTTVAPRSHVLLLRVGQRILIVSDSSAGMRTLDSVQEPEEVAGLLGAVDAVAPTSMSKSFNGVMKKLSGQWSDAELVGASGGEDEAVVGDGVGLDQTRGTVSSVRGRLAQLAKAGGEA